MSHEHVTNEPSEQSMPDIGSDIVVVASYGQEITHTNYWDSENALVGGYCFLSGNAGAVRLLVPDSQISVVDEIRPAKRVILSRGPWAAEGEPDATEVMFESDDGGHFSVTVRAHQTDRSLLDEHQGGGLICAVWTRSGKQLQLPAYYREVASLPCHQPWTVH